MTSFSRFKEIVRAMGGQWAGPHGVFSRTQSEYHAACNGEWVHLLRSPTNRVVKHKTTEHSFELNP